MLQFPFPQVTKNRFDGVLGRVPLNFVRESLSMSGFGREIQPKKTSNVEKKRPEKLKATRLSGDVDVVRFSAPKMLGANKAVNKNTVMPKPSLIKKERVNDVENHGNASSTTVTQHEVSNEQERGSNDTVKKVGEPADGMSNEKKENVQRTVKKILSGTRLFTKAVNPPRSSYSRNDRQKQNVTERQ